MEGKYLKLSDIDCYVEAYHLSNLLWNKIIILEYFIKKTLGTQYMRAIDSISSNIAEGFGRYHKKDKIKFYRYALGSSMESLDWTQKAYIRKLISKEEYDNTLKKLETIRIELYRLIKYTNEKLKE